MITTVGFALWCAVWWRLRGGAFTALTGIDPGTGGMRAIAAVAITAPLLIVSWRYAFLVPAFWVAWSLSGWGAFQGMGAEGNPVETKNPVALVLWDIGLRSKVAIDLLGMAVEGIFCTLVVALPIELLTHHNSLLPALGLLFAPIYFIAQHSKYPNFGRFADAGSEWAEVLVGALVGFIIWMELFQ